jgi:hypothetical protein
MKVIMLCQGIQLLSTTDTVLVSVPLSRLTPGADEITGVNSVDFDVISQLKVRNFCLH